MNIQPSVILWTIICFVILMLILNNLLFKPVLRVMDERRERIKKAADKKADQERQAAKRRSERQEEEAALQIEAKKRVKEEIEAIRADSRKAVDEARDERLHALDSYRRKTEAEHQEIIAVLTTHAEELAAAFADSVTRG